MTRAALLSVILLTGCHLRIMTPPVPGVHVGGHSVHLTWVASTTPGVSYNVYRKAEACSGTAAFVKINPSPVTAVAYDDLNIADGVYCYHVTSYLASTIPPESAPSNLAEATVQPPSPPTNLTVSPAAVTTNVGGRQQFLAMRGDTAVPAAWIIDPQEGTIDATGLYLAPASIKGNNIHVQVTARESASSATADITLRK